MLQNDKQFMNTRTAPSIIDGLVERIFRQKLDEALQAPIRFSLPSGYVFDLGPDKGGACPQWSLRSWNGLSRVLFSGPLGMAEGYINDEWTSNDLPGLLTRLADAMNSIKTPPKRLSPSHLAAVVKHATNRNSRSGSRRNIEFHYDLGNAFYQLWLDPSMTYSSAEFESNAETLTEGQQAKYRNTCEALKLKPGDRVLEIGCGWGGFAEYAVRHYDCHVTGITLSSEQLNYAQAVITTAGLEDSVELRLQDYRDLDGQFDAIVSIEMLEAVGEANWDSYFDRVQHCLKPGARAAIQVITISDLDYSSYRLQPDFIQKYIFPGGMLPTNKIVGERAEAAGLKPLDVKLFGASYSRTLALWAKVFNARWPEIEHLGFNARFKRIWDFYLAYCEAGFQTERINVGRFVYQKPD